MGRSFRSTVARASVACGAAILVVAAGVGAIGPAVPAAVGASVSGVVLDDGTVPAVPVDGVEVCVGDASRRTCVTTGTDGRYSFSGLTPGSYSLTANPPSGTAYLPIGGTGDYVPVPAVVVALAAGATVQDLRLVTGGGLEVTLRQPDGITPAAAEPVVACRTDDAGPGACPDGIVLPPTDATGRTTGPPLLPGTYRVRAGQDTAVVGAATADRVFVDPGVTTPLRLTLVDVAPPVVTATPDRAPEPSGWYLGPVTVTWAATDPTPGSGLVLPLPAPSTFGTEGTNTYLSDDVYDRAGNHAAGRVSLRIDSIPPSVTCPENATFSLGAADAVITATVRDDAPGSSGPAAAAVSVAVDTAAVGVGSVSVTGRDVAGNATTVGCAYTVEGVAAYTFRGFGWPVSNRVINLVRSGRHVPLTWRVTDGSGAPVTGPGTVVAISSAPVACPELRSERLDVALPFAVRPTSLGGGFWLATWQAPKADPGGCIELRLALDDGSTHTAVFRVVR